MTSFLCDVCNKEYTDFSPENVSAVLDKERKFIRFKFICLGCLEKED